MNTLKNIAFSLFIFAGMIVVIVKGVIPGWQEGRTDFSNYYASSVLLKNGESISNFYNNDWFISKAKLIGENQGAKFSPFPPATAFLYLPVSFFKPLTAKRIWLVVNTCMLFLLIVQLKSLGGFSLRDTLFFLSLFCIPLATNISFGQCYLLIVVTITFFLNSLRSKSAIFSSSALGLVSSIKYFPVIYILFAFPNPPKKGLLFFLIAILVSILLPVFVNGPEVYKAFLSHFFSHLNGNLPGQGQYAFSFQSIDVLLANLFILDSIKNPVVLLDAPLLKTILKIAFASIVILLSFNAIKKGIKQTKEFSISIAVIGASLIIPASATYHLLLLVPAVFVIFKWVKNNVSNKIYFISIFILVGTICNLMFFFIPNIDFNTNLNKLVHFPRLYSLIGLFSLLLHVQNRYLKNHV